MICRITGEVVEHREGSVVLATGDICYDVAVPTVVQFALRQLSDTRVTLHTIQIFEGNASIGNLTPKLYGFLSENERAFCQLLTRVKGVSLRKALRAFAVPLAEIATAIERGDERFLTGLPELGKKTASQIITELKGRVSELAGAPAGMEEQQPRELNNAQQLALEILTQWGERPIDAQRWVVKAVEADISLVEPDAIVKAVYRIKQTVRT